MVANGNTKYAFQHRILKFAKMLAPLLIIQSSPCFMYADLGMKIM